MLPRVCWLTVSLDCLSLRRRHQDISKLRQIFPKRHGAIQPIILIFSNTAVSIILELCESQSCYHFHYVLQCMCSSVGIATELRAGRSGDRIKVGRDFPPFQTDPGAHPASCTMGTGSFPEVKYDRGLLLTTHPFLVPRSWKSRAIPLPTLWATTGPVTGALYIFHCVQMIK